MKRLPKIMVAPNGAHRTKSDHAMLPVTIPELCQVALSCFNAGAEGIHIHVRDDHGKHSLDTELYKEALAELSKTVPEMLLQITSEAGGLFGPETQRNAVLKSGANYVSVAAKEMALEPDVSVTRRFYSECEFRGIAVQHIIYEPKDLYVLKRFLSAGAIADPNLQLLFVLGRYTPDGAKGPEALTQFQVLMSDIEITPDWAVCAFGEQETNCLVAAKKLGGKLRVGFENSWFNRDGTVAMSNAERVAEIARMTRDLVGK